jgi:serine O-acetyltransferase
MTAALGIYSTVVRHIMYVEGGAFDLSSNLENLSIELWQTPRGNYFWFRVLVLLFVLPNNGAANAYIRLAQHFERGGRRRLSRWMGQRLQREFGCTVSPKSEIGPGLKLPHPNGIVIGEGVVIGERCTIFQQVTIGGARTGDWRRGAYPCIKSDVTIFAGAKLLGQISIGSNVTVGANAVVTRDVPDDHVAVGVPAFNRPIKQKRVDS